MRRRRVRLLIGVHDSIFAVIYSTKLKLKVSSSQLPHFMKPNTPMGQATVRAVSDSAVCASLIQLD